VGEPPGSGSGTGPGRRGEVRAPLLAAAELWRVVS